MSDDTLQAAARMTAGASMWETPDWPERGVRRLKLADGPMGIASGRVDERDIALLTPCPTALGASWDLELVGRVGALVGGEAVRLGVDAVLAPNLNLARSPLSGRAFEYFSEDPLLAGLAGVAWANGLQVTGTAAVAKHLVCNDSETARDTMNAVVDERTLREVYLLPFELSAEAGVGGMLTAYNRVNGAYCAEQHHVVTQVVKGEWGYPGVLMSDWFGTHSTVATLTGGLDLEMPGPARFLGTKAAEAVATGDVPAERVADAADRVAAFAQRFGREKRPPLDPIDADALLIEAAAAGFVLLKNENGLLPLVPGRDRTIAVIGPNATAPCFQGGTFAKIAVTPEAIRPLDAIRARYGEHCRIVHAPGVDPQPRLPAMPVRPARDLGDGKTRGMTVDYFATPDASGAPIGSETRDANSLVWFVGVHDLGVFDRPASIRASGLFLPEVSGTHTLYLGGTGAVGLRVDGVEALRRDEPVAASDVMGKLKRGDADSATVTLEAGREVAIEVTFVYDPARVHGLWYGIRAPGTPEAMLAEAVETAHAADAVILIVGETSDSSVESKDRADTRLPAEQIRLIEAVTAANPRTAIVANVGHAFDTAWDACAPALICAWYPGQEFGRALADVLAGDREPGGRMPVTIAMRDEDYPAFDLTPDAKGDLPYRDGTRLGYRGLATAGVAPRHAFGSGRGYADFAIEDIAFSVDAQGGAIVTAVVRNTSDRAGGEVLQVYREEPERTLVGFARMWCAAGETQAVRIVIAERRLSIWNDGWRRLPRVTLLAGRSATDIVARAEIALASAP